MVCCCPSDVKAFCLIFTNQFYKNILIIFLSLWKTLMQCLQFQPNTGLLLMHKNLLGVYSADIPVGSMPSFKTNFTKNLELGKSEISPWQNDIYIYTRFYCHKSFKFLSETVTVSMNIFFFSFSFFLTRKKMQNLRRGKCMVS